MVESVRGHICERLERFQNEGGGCEPSLTAAGNVQGCDATNYVFILFCPFCGIRLPEPQFICGDCHRAVDEAADLDNSGRCWRCED